MTHFLSRLVQRTRGETATVRPASPAVTAPDPSAGAWDEHVVVREAAPLVPAGYGAPPGVAVSPAKPAIEAADRLAGLEQRDRERLDDSERRAAPEPLDGLESDRAIERIVAPPRTLRVEREPHATAGRPADPAQPDEIRERGRTPGPPAEPSGAPPPATRFLSSIPRGRTPGPPAEPSGAAPLATRFLSSIPRGRTPGPPAEPSGAPPPATRFLSSTLPVIAPLAAAAAIAPRESGATAPAGPAQEAPSHAGMLAAVAERASRPERSAPVIAIEPDGDGARNEPLAGPEARHAALARAPLARTRASIADPASRGALHRAAASRAPASAEPSVHQAQTTVEVSIGRIEVRLPPRPRADGRDAAPPSRRPVVGLAEYLRERDSGKSS